jgi:acyl-CoA reductase-like NAD-dependent aldehyde dehydrogenase
MVSVAEVFESMAWGPAPEAAEPAVAWLEQHNRSFGHLIGSAWRLSSSTFAVFNPANRQVLARAAQGSVEDVDAAVRAARDAAEAWRATPGHVRARYLYALARQVQKHSRLFAVLESLDNGKPIRESRDLDIPLVARHFAYHAGWAQLMSRELPDYEPIGVVGQIIPWNFPLLMLAWKVAPALAMGNTVVLKPAEFTPLTALLFAEISRAVGLPPGVLNVVTGDGETGAALVAHPGVDKIAFTGSTEVGRLIRQSTAGSGKRLSLELGGKSPFVVFDDADLDGAVEGLVDAIWFNQGQVCCAGSRLLVQESIESAFLAKVRRRMASLRVGDPLDKAIDIGAIVAPSQLDRIVSLVDAGREAGAEVWQPPDACPTDGWFYPPTLVTRVGPASELAQVEIFGPVLVSMSFRTPAEAVGLANNTRYGLAASVWTQDIDQALDVARGIQAGTVWINSTNLFDASSGFGGYRESGFGREGGREGLFEYVRQRGGVTTRGVTGSVTQSAESVTRSGEGVTSHTETVTSEHDGVTPEHDGVTPGDEDVTSNDDGVTPGDEGVTSNDDGVTPGDEGVTSNDDGVTSGDEGVTSNDDGVTSEHDGVTPGDEGVTPGGAWPEIDRTPKLYIGGKQARPDSGYSRLVYGYSGEPLGEIGEGNRKDVRNAVEAAHAALGGWSGATAYNRAQVLYYVAENLAARAREFSARLSNMTGVDGAQEVEQAIEALFTWAAFADKFEGSVHQPPLRGEALAIPEPIGVVGVACPSQQPLLGLVNLVGPLVSMGNTVVVIPSEAYPLSAIDLYQVLDTSDVPGGVVNIVTGDRDALAQVLAEHDDVDALWYVGTPEGRRVAEAASVGNMKRTWAHLESDFPVHAMPVDEALREAVQIKNIWVIHSI